MDQVRRQKATNKQRSEARKARAADYRRMAVAASSVVIENRNRQYRTGDPEYILVEFPHWAKFRRGFPKGLVVAKTLNSNTHKINAVKLLNWLYEQGYSKYDSKMLVKQTGSVERLFNEIDKLLDKS